MIRTTSMTRVTSAFPMWSKGWKGLNFLPSLQSRGWISGQGDAGTGAEQAMEPLALSRMGKPPAFAGLAHWPEPYPSSWPEPCLAWLCAPDDLWAMVLTCCCDTVSSPSLPEEGEGWHE